MDSLLLCLCFPCRISLCTVSQFWLNGNCCWNSLQEPGLSCNIFSYNLLRLLWGILLSLAYWKWLILTAFMVMPELWLVSGVL